MPAVLLQADKLGWSRVGGKNGAVSSARMLLSLPGSKNVVALDSGVELTLWGNLFEVTLDPTLAVSRAILHVNEAMDADLTLDRGRILLRNDKKAGKDAVARVRFVNPTLSEENFFDIILTAGSTVAIERRRRNGPRRAVLRGSEEHASARPDRDNADLPSQRHVHGPMGEAAIRSGRNAAAGGAMEQPGVVALDAEKSDPAAVDQGDADIQKRRSTVCDRAIVIQTHDAIAKRLERDKQIDVVLAEFVEDLQNATQKELNSKKGITPDVYLPWRHIFRCYAAIDDAGSLFDTFAQDNTPMFVRSFAMMTLQQWLPEGRDHDYGRF